MSTVLAEAKQIKKVASSTRKPASRPKPLFDYDSPEFTEALSRHFHAAKCAALKRKGEMGALPSGPSSEEKMFVYKGIYISKESMLASMRPKISAEISAEIKAVSDALQAAVAAGTIKRVVVIDSSRAGSTPQQFDGYVLSTPRAKATK